MECLFAVADRRVHHGHHHRSTWASYFPRAESMSWAQARSDRVVRHRAADPGRSLPGGDGRHRRGPGPVRQRQDRRAADPLQVVQRRHHRLRGVRGAGQRDDRRAHRIPRVGGSAERAPAHGAHHPCGQHLQYAGGGPRGKYLHRSDYGGILPGHGLPGGPDGRLHQPVGRGVARDLLPRSTSGPGAPSSGGRTSGSER